MGINSSQIRAGKTAAQFRYHFQRITSTLTVRQQMVWQVEQVVSLFHIVHHTEIQVRVLFICRVPLSNGRNRHLSLSVKRHVLGTVHFTSKGHFSLSYRLSGNVIEKKPEINYNFISYNICISADP